MRYGFAIIVIAFLVIVGSVIVATRGDGASAPSLARFTKLVDYENNDTANVSWTMQGRLVGQDQRRDIRITVNRNKRVVEILHYYGERVEQSAEYPNSPTAFAAFVRALDNASFGRERIVKQADERGVCPLGNRFIYRLTDSSEEVMRTWSDTCAAADGPFGGGKTAQLIQQLFKAQITDYNKFTVGVSL